MESALQLVLCHLVCEIGCALFFVTHYSQASDFVRMVNSCPVGDLGGMTSSCTIKWITYIWIICKQNQLLILNERHANTTGVDSVVLLYRAVDGPMRRLRAECGSTCRPR